METKIKREYLILTLLFLFVLGFRLFFAFRQDFFNTDEAYFHLRHINYLVENYSLLDYDSLSYGGRFVFYPPLFHIAMALLSFGSIFMLKLIPELFFASTVFIIYAISKEISGSSYSALFAAATSAFIPLLFIETLNSISVYSFVIPLLFLMIYSLMHLDDKKYFWIFILCTFLLPLIHPSSLIFVITVVAYFLLISGGAIISTKLKKEAVIFSVLIISLFELIIYKKAFFEFGVNLLKQNVPSTILADNFRQLAPLDLLIGIGLLPLVLGGLGIYFSLMREKKKMTYIFGAFALSVLLLIVLRLITISIGLMFLGISLSVFTAPAVSFIYNYFNKFKFNFLKYSFVTLLVLMFILLSVSPSFLVADKSATVDEYKIKEIEWFIKNTAESDVILANIDEGNLIAVIANRKTVADSNFLFAPKTIERVNDIDTIYKTVSEAIALKLIHKYDIDVIYLSDDTRRQYGILELAYAGNVFNFGAPEITEDSECFRTVKRGTYYVVKC